MLRSCRSPRVGAATVEFAVIAPVLILLVLGMIEVGRGVNVQHVLLNAARAGCRVAIIEGATQQTINDRVEDNLAGSGVSAPEITVTPNPLSSAVTGDPVTVTVTVNYGDVSWVPVPKFLAGTDISGICSLPHE